MGDDLWRVLNWGSRKIWFHWHESRRQKQPCAERSGPLMKTVLFTDAAFKKKEILSFAAISMDPEDIILSEISWVQEDERCMNSLI